MSLAEMFALPNEEWMEDGLCKQTDPECFFPEVGCANTDAKAVCARCPVIDLCREYALQRHEFGVWGGLSERERHVLQGRRAS